MDKTIVLIALFGFLFSIMLAAHYAGQAFGTHYSDGIEEAYRSGCYDKYVTNADCYQEYTYYWDTTSGESGVKKRWDDSRSVTSFSFEGNSFTYEYRSSKNSFTGVYNIGGMEYKVSYFWNSDRTFTYFKSELTGVTKIYR